MSLEDKIINEIVGLRATVGRLTEKVERLEHHVVPNGDWITAKEAMALLACGKNTFYDLHRLHLRKRRGKHYDRAEVEARAAKFSKTKAS